MNKFILSISFIIFSLMGKAQIDFKVKNLEEAINQAQKENKIIFVDAYTTWCGPCKWMAKKVFTDPQVSEYYNAKFINFKIDMEKGEGLSLSNKWAIKGYPTLLYLDTDGEIIHRSIGARDAGEFLDLGAAAIDPDRQVVTLQKRYAAGETSPEFLKKYTKALTSAGEKGFGEIAERYMDSQKDWTTEENMQFIFDYSEANVDSKLFKYTMQHKNEFIALVGKEKYDMKIEYAAENARTKAGIARDNIQGMKTHYTQFFDEKKAYNKSMEVYLRSVMYSKDPVVQEKFIADAQLFLSTKPDLTWNFYNSVAWQVYEITDDKEVLKQAIEWTHISLTKERNSYNTDTQAAIYYKIGNMKLAKKFAEESIKLAQESGNDFTATQELLDKINKK